MVELIVRICVRKFCTCARFLFVMLVVCLWCVLVRAALVCCVGVLCWWCVLRSMRADMLNPCVLKAI